MQRSAQLKQKTNSSTKIRCQNSGLQDTIISLNHRLAFLESSLNSKIDRAQCMMIMQNKASKTQLKKIWDEVNQFMTEELRKHQQKNLKSSEEIEANFKKLASKLSKKSLNNINKNSPISIIAPQDLYLQSNETMFGLIVDEISDLKKEHQHFQKLLLQRNQATINFHNEVCQKIDRLQQQLQTNQQRINKSQFISKQFKQSMFRRMYEEQKLVKSGLRKQQEVCGRQLNGKTFQKAQSHSPNMLNICENSIQLIKLENLTRSVEIIQEEMTQKINIKDVMSLIKKNFELYPVKIQQIKQFTQEALNSTKKILDHQSQINQQLCSLSRVGWWQSFQQAQGYALWNRQISNMIPQIFEFNSQSNYIKLTQQGTYIIKLLSINSQYPDTIMIGNQQFDLNSNQLLVRVQQKNSQLKIPSQGNQFLLKIQKL